MLPPTTTFCADSAGIVTISFKVYNQGEPGNYRINFPDNSDTIITNVVGTATVTKRFMFDCGQPPGKPTPPRSGALFFEYQGALTITRTDCVDERGDNQQGSYDFRVVPNPITNIKTSNLTCIKEPFVVDFEGIVCSEKLIESYQWYMDGVKLEGEVAKKLNDFRFDGPGEHVVRLEVATFKGCDKYFYEKVFNIRPTPQIKLSYIIDTAELCNPNLQIITNSEYKYATAWQWSSTSSDVSFSDPNAPNPVINIDNNRAGTRQITVRVSNPYCSGVSETFYITTQRGQTIEVLEDILTCTGYDLDLCANLKFLPTPDNIVWSSNKPGVIFNDSTITCPKVRFPEVGQYVLTARGNDVCGESFSIPIKVRVRDGTELEIDITNIDTICTTEAPIALLDYVSRPDNVDSITGPGVADFIFYPSLVEGNIDVTVVDSCGKAYPLQFLVIPQERYTGEAFVICEGDQIDLFAEQPGEYTGTGVKENVFRSKGLSIGVYKIKFNSLTFCGGLDSLNIVVQEFPKASFQIVTDTCAGDEAAVYAGLQPLTVENRSTARVICYEVLETGKKECDRDRARFTFREPGTYTIQQVVAFPNGQCTDTTTQTIQVLFPPVLDFTAEVDSSTCDSLSILFSVGPQPEGWMYEWSFTTTDMSTLATPVVELIRPLAPEVLGVEASLTNACYTTEDTFEVVLPLRFQVSFDILNDNNTVCSDDTIWLSNTSVNATDFRVTYPDGRQQTQLPEFLVIRNTGKQVLKYPIKLKGSNVSCPDEFLVDTVYVLPITTVAAFGLNYDNICSQADVTLDNSSTPGALTFVYWGDGSSPQFIDEQESLLHSYDVDRDTTFRIMLIARLCGIDTFFSEITVRPSPDAAFSLLAEEANCVDKAINFLPAAGDDAFGLEWSFGDGENSQQPYPQHRYGEPGNYIAYLEATSTNGCSSIDSIMVNIGEYNGQALDFTLAANACTFGPFPIDFRSPESGLTIDYGNGTVSPTPVDQPYFEPGTYKLNLQATSANGCSIDSSMKVRVYPDFDAEIQTSTRDTFVELGDYLDLSVKVTPPRNIQEVLWQGDSVVNPYAPYTRAQPINDGFYTIELLDEYGCTATDSMRVRVIKDYDSRIYAPNAFSPNEDGFNDRFNLDVKANTVAGIPYMRVMSRFGGIVYECTDCPTGSVNEGWDGRVGGKPIESNVYIWAAEIDFVDGTSQLFTGDITLLR